MDNIMAEMRANDPYPPDVFVEPPEEDYTRLHEICKAEFDGCDASRFFGAWGRHVRNFTLDEIERRVKELVEDD